jgi:hypothetical protein
MSIFIQEVLGLLNRNQKKITLDKTKDWFEFGKLYQSSSLNNKSGYTPKMDPFVIKWGDLVCQATEDLTRTLPGQGNLGFVPVYTDPSGSCNWDTLKDSIITQNALNTIINIAGSLQVLGDVQISGGDLTATTSTFNLLNTAPVSIINFGSTTTNIEVGGAATVVNINGTTQSTSCTTGALVIDGGVGIAKDLFVCGNANITGDAAINGGDLTSTASNFNLLQQSTTIGFGYNSSSIFIGGISTTSTVVINGSQDSISCTTGALRIVGGVGIAKSLFVCGNLNIDGTSNLNGDVNLGNSLADQIALNGTLLDNNGNAPLLNQVLVGQGGGQVAWQNDDVVEALTYGALWRGNSSNVKEQLLIGTANQILISNGTTFAWQNNPAAIVGEVCAVNSIPLWTPNSNTLGCSLIYQDGNSSTPATKIFLKGGLASEGSQVRTTTDVALGYGNYAGGEASAAFNFRTLALGGDSFAAGHKGFAGGHGSLAAGYNTGAGNYGFGLFGTTVTSATLNVNILSGTIAVGNFIYANVGTDPSIRYEILTVTPTIDSQVFNITIATPISVNANEAFAIEEAVPDRGDSQGAIALGVTAVSKGIGAVAIGTRAATDVPNQIAIGSSFTTVKLDGITQDDTQNKVLVIDASNIVRWRSATSIGGGGGTITANNGLTMSTATNVQLGGTLLQSTTIQTSTFDLKLEGTSAIPILNVNQLGTNSGSAAIKGTTTGGFAGYFEGFGDSLGAVYANISNITYPTIKIIHSAGGVPGRFERLGANNTGIGTVLDLYNTCNTGPAITGLGAAINFNLETSGSVIENAGNIAFDWTSVTTGSASSRFSIKTVNSSVASNSLELYPSGQLKLNKYGVNTFAGSAVYLLGVTATGAVIETTVSGSGTVTNVSALNIQTTGTDITSSVDFPTTTPIIRLNIPTASAVNRGALSAADWITFNAKQGAITLTTTGSSGAATLIGNVLNIPQYSGGSTPTNLSTSQTATNFTINSDTGTDAIVPLGNGTLAGATLNNYTTAEQTKLAGIAAGAEVNVNADWNATSGDAEILNKPTIFAEPGIFSGGGIPSLAPGVTGAEIRTLIGAGTPIVDEDFVKNTADIYPETPKVTQIITLSQAQYEAIVAPLDSTLYIIV